MERGDASGPKDGNTRLYALYEIAIAESGTTQSVDGNMPPALRQRAAKACRRCAKRKVKCDAATAGPPCSRCRMDGKNDCILVDSQRGLYQRIGRHRAPSSCSRTPVTAPAAVDSTTDRSSVLTIPSSEGPVLGRRLRYGASTSDLPGRSLAGMFEDFVEERERGGMGIILFGEASPLTFALEEHTGDQACFYDARPTLSSNKQLVDRPREIHPPHCSSEDIAYLVAKGAFTLPDPQTFQAFFDTFMTRFYPLYTIVNRSELLEAHKRNTLPWIMLHGICLVGATFCDASVIHRTNYKSRAEARQAYYEKAKVLWSTNYETDKFVLLETVLMLSFLGPQMNSVYNACSWLDFAFTIAESMGIHRSTSSLGVSTKDKGRVKRLWWTLAVRDAYCAALLGRPFRINIPQCDVSMLELEDFASEFADSQSHDSAIYQIEVARLSIIARAIIQRRFHSSDVDVDLTDLQKDLQTWRSQLPSEVSLQGSTSNKNIFAVSLELLYHQHIILLHFDRANCPSSPSMSRTANIASANSATVAAQAIASSASSLVTNHMINRLPHEIFMGFFISGIVYYRQINTPDPLVSQIARASLDNCRMLLHEARDAWDPAHWSIRIFDFLLSRAQEQARTAENEKAPVDDHASDPAASNVFGEEIPGLHQQDLSMNPMDFADLPDLSIPGTFDDFLLMPNFFLPTA